MRDLLPFTLFLFISFGKSIIWMSSSEQFIIVARHTNWKTLYIGFTLSLKNSLIRQSWSPQKLHTLQSGKDVQYTMTFSLSFKQNTLLTSIQASLTRSNRTTNRYNNLQTGFSYNKSFTILKCSRQIFLWDHIVLQIIHIDN